jgi:hypothetical protein
MTDRTTAEKITDLVRRCYAERINSTDVLSLRKTPKGGDFWMFDLLECFIGPSGNGPLLLHIEHRPDDTAGNVKVLNEQEKGFGSGLELTDLLRSEFNDPRIQKDIGALKERAALV